MAEEVNHSLHYGGDTTYEAIKVMDGRFVRLPKKY